jgi:hypothetical protein
MTRNGRLHAAIRTLLRVTVLISPFHHRDLHAAHDLEKPGIVAQHTAYASTHKKEKGEQGQGAMQVSTVAYKAEMRPGCLISRKRKKVHILFLACFCSKVYDILAFLLSVLLSSSSFPVLFPPLYLANCPRRSFLHLVSPKCLHPCLCLCFCFLLLLFSTSSPPPSPTFLQGRECGNLRNLDRPPMEGFVRLRVRS